MRPGFFRNHKGKVTENDVLEAVVDGGLFGMVELDIHVPETWSSCFEHQKMSPYDYFKEMSPLFCSTDIPIGSYLGVSPVGQTQTTVGGGMKARQILLAIPLLQWYLKHGLVVTKIYQIIEFQKQRCFRNFVQDVSDARRQGDVDTDTAIIADTNKVIGNSSYGSLIMDKSKHSQVKYVQGENETCLKKNDPLFQKLECLDEEEQIYEVEMAKHRIKLDLPIQLGFFILQYAKVRMLEFYYDFMDVFVDRADFEYCEMDTDSAYMAISGSNLEDIIKPEMRTKYLQGLKGFCADINIEADAQHHWFPRTCCKEHAQYDKRTPGLFKLENQGNKMIGLCSKTYIVRKTKVLKPTNTRISAFRLMKKAKGCKLVRSPLQCRRVNEYKFSSKGVSKRHLTAPMTKFRSVLKTRKAQSGFNCSFRVRKNVVFTYTQERRGFSYLYCKRKVLPDGIHTEPLDVTLCPLPLEEREVSDQDLVEMLASNFED